MFKYLSYIDDKANNWYRFQKNTKFIPNALGENWSGNSIYGNWSLCKFCKIKNIKKRILKRELKNLTNITNI